MGDGYAGIFLYFCNLCLAKPALPQLLLDRLTMGSRIRFSEIIQSIPTKEISDAYSFGVKYGLVDLALHPLDFADTLIRLGYEPFPPVEREGMFQRKSLHLPSLPAYVYYLYLIDGYSGLFRGAVPYVTSTLINRHLTNYIDGLSPFTSDAPENEPRLSEEFTEKNVAYFCQKRFWRLVSNVITIHVSYPFHVIAVRTMARFVTSAATEEGARPAMNESWVTELLRIRDVSELFAGCQAKILREILFAVISASTFLALMKVVQTIRTDPQQADNIENAVEYIGHNLGGMYTSPFRNASDIMIINRTDIPLGNPPFIEPFTTCWDCMTHLRGDKFWKAAPYLSRPYIGPREYYNDRMYPRDTMFGPYHMPPGYHYQNQNAIDDLPGFIQMYYDVWRKMGVQPGGDLRSLHDIFSEGGRIGKETRAGSIALSGVRSMLSERHALPSSFFTPSYSSLGGCSNPFRI